MEIGAVSTAIFGRIRIVLGGAKQSGVGRESGLHSLEFDGELANVCVKL